MRLFERTPPGPDDVMNHLGVSLDDTLLNRSGRMSERQKEILRRERRLALLFYVVVVLLVGGFIWFIRDALPSSLSEVGLIELMMLVLFGGIIAYKTYTISLISDDLNNDAVTVQAGHIRRRVTGSNRSRVYQIIVNEVRFQVSRSIYNAFIDGDYYHIYHAPRSKILLNAIHDATQRHSSV